MSRNTSVVWAITCVVMAAIIGLMLRPLTPIDETRYLAVAWEMHQSGNWLVPSKNFAAYSDKPPLLFWAINLIWMITGVSEFAARLVGPISAGLAVWLTAVLARRLWPQDDAAGGRAALALAGLAVFGLAGGMVMFDVPLAVTVLFGLICLSYAGSRGLAPWLGFGAAIALGVLTKGPVILFHLLPAALLLPLWSPTPLAWRTSLLRLGVGLLAGIGLLLLWLVPAAITGGAEYRDAILWHQSAGRLAQSFAHARPWWFYLALLPVLSFPLGWSPALWRAGVQTRWLQDRGLRLCLIWGAAAILLFSLTSGKQIHYLVPELPAIALIAAALSRLAPRPGFWPAGLPLIAAAVAAALAAAGLLPTGRALDLMTPRTALIAWALLLLALIWLALRRQGFGAAMLLSLGGLMATNLLIGTTGFGAAYSTHPIAAIIAPAQDRGLAYIGGRYHAEFNFAARLRGPVATPADAAALALWSKDHPCGQIIGQRGPDEPSWPPREVIPFRASTYGIWATPSAATCPQEP